MAELLSLDIRTLIAVLFWGNLTLLILIAAYIPSNKQVKGSLLLKYFIGARSCFICSFFLLFFREQSSNLLVVSLTNSFLLLGFYLEALSMLTVIGYNTKVIHLTMRMILCVCLMTFCLFAYLFPYSNVYVAIASICVFCVLIIPDMLLMFNRNVNFFKRFIGIFYSFFLILMPLRAIYAMMNTDLGILTNFIIQTLSFMSLVLMMIYSSFATLLLLNEEVEMRLNIMATTDALTELSNRNSFTQKAAKYLEQGFKDAEPLTFLFLDIDYFKKINDQYGHIFGDKVLIEFAQTLRANLRATDLCCRFGGEEFIIVLYGCSHEEGRAVAERIRQQIKDTRFEKLPDFTYTVSIGVRFGIPREGDTVTEFINQADKALYQAKATGRDKIVEYKSAMG